MSPPRSDPHAHLEASLRRMRGALEQNRNQYAAVVEQIMAATGADVAERVTARLAERHERRMDRWRRRKMVYRGKMLFYRKNYGRLRTALLRLMFGGLSVSKMLAWSGALVVPEWRNRARYELRSNLDVLWLCRKLV